MSSTRMGAPPLGARLGLPSSARLARRAAGGDESAFEEIFRRYHQELYRYCLAILHRPEDAEDAVQATMAAAMRALPGDEREISLRPWLYRVAHNESISVLRGRGPAADPERAEEAISVPPEAELADRDRLRQLVDDLKSLPERQRSAIVMRELNDLSYAEIGGALSCSEPSARQTVYEARRGLQDLAEGRAMECDAVRESISAGDRRRLRGRAIRSHLRSCDGCLAFEAAMEQRRTDLQVLCSPLPAMAAAGMLGGLLGGAGGGVATGVAAAGGAGATVAGAGIAGSLAVKGAALAAAVVVAAGAADVGGLIDVPGPIDGDRDSGQAAPASGPDDAERSPASGSAADGDAAGGSSAGTPSNSGLASGRDDTGPGRSENAPGQTGEGPGKSESAPGRTGEGPGKSESAPGQTGESPGKSEDAPGHGGSSPGKSESAPGQTGSPGKSDSAPGQTGSAGKSESAPGQTGASGNSGSAPGQTGSSGKPESPPPSSQGQSASPPAPAPAPPKPTGPPPEAGNGPKPK